MCNELLSNDVTLTLSKCSGCHSIKLIEHFEINKKGLFYKTCTQCRTRNKNRNNNNMIKSKFYNLDTVLSIDSVVEKADDNIILQLNTKNEFIRKLLKYMGTEPIEFIRCNDCHNKDIDIKIVFPLREAMIILSWGDSWNTIKKLIDKELCNSKSKECSICCELYETDYAIKRFPRMSCKNCFNDYCMACFLNIFEKNNGFIVCPYCRISSGFPFEGCTECLLDFTSDVGVKMLRLNYNNIPFGFSKSI